MGVFNCFNEKVQDSNDELTFGRGMGKRLVEALAGLNAAAAKPSGLVAKPLVGKVERGKTYLDRLDREVTITGCSVKPPGTPVYQGETSSRADVREYTAEGELFGYGRGPHSGDLVAVKPEPKRVYWVTDGKGGRFGGCIFNSQTAAEEYGLEMADAYPHRGPFSVVHAVEAESKPVVATPKYQPIGEIVPRDFNPGYDTLRVESDQTDMTDRTFTVTGYSDGRWVGTLKSTPRSQWYLDKGKFRLVEHTRGQR